MRKTSLLILGVLAFIGGFISIQSGVLKADEILEKTSSKVEPMTSDVSANSLVSVEEVPTLESITESTIYESRTVYSSTSTTSPAISSSTSSSTNPTISSSTSSSSNPAISSSTSSSSNPTISSSTSSSSNPAISSSTSSSTNPTISSSTSSSTNSSATIPSSTAGSQASTNQSQEVPKQSASPVVTPEGPTTAAGIPTAPNTASVKANSFVAPTAPDAFSETSTLNLPSELKTTEVAQSDLKGFELPLLSSFENKAQAALIYEGIKQLGTEQEENYSAEQFASDMYQSLFHLEISNNPEKLSEEITVGSLIYQKDEDENRLLGIYIGDDYYLSVDDVEIEKETDSTSDKKETQRQVVVETLNVEEDLLAQDFPEAVLTDYGEQVVAEYPASMNITENESAKSFIETIGEDARTLGQEYDVFASVMIAQALLESGSGTSTLSLAPNYNLFGIKGTYQGQAVSMATQEDRGNGELYSIQSSFRKYPNYAASLGDYVELLRGGISGNDSYYKQAWRSTAKNYLRTTNALTGTYATDTSYGRKLNSIIALYHLTQYDQPKVEATASGIFIKEKEEIPEEYRSRMKYPDFNGVNYNTSGSYPVGQCTWYAFNRVKQLGKTVDDYMGNGGQWAAKGKALGYEVSQKPKAGWLISFKPGVAGSDPRYGHVAFVEVVRPEGILISEGNVYGGTVISYRLIEIELATSNQVSYINSK